MGSFCIGRDHDDRRYDSFWLVTVMCAVIGWHIGLVVRVTLVYSPRFTSSWHPRNRADLHTTFSGEHRDPNPCFASDPPLGPLVSPHLAPISALYFVFWNAVTTCIKIVSEDNELMEWLAHDSGVMWNVHRLMATFCFEPLFIV